MTSSLSARVLLSETALTRDKIQIAMNSAVAATGRILMALCCRGRGGAVALFCRRILVSIEAPALSHRNP
jgi:hypothetical protein